eukprot:52718-Chlamydomonas_euryale.AAC.2
MRGQTVGSHLHMRLIGATCTAPRRRLRGLQAPHQHAGSTPACRLLNPLQTLHPAGFPSRRLHTPMQTPHPLEGSPPCWLPTPQALLPPPAYPRPVLMATRNLEPDPELYLNPSLNLT